MKPILTVVTAIPLLLAAGAVVAGPDSAAEVRTYLESEGFEVLGDIDFESDSGVWEADIRGEGGDRIEVHVDPVTGRIVFGDEDPLLRNRPHVVRTVPDTAPRDVVIVREHVPEAVVVERETVLVPVPGPLPPPNAFGAADVRVILSDAGFHDIHDIAYDDGRWKAEARDSRGDDYEVHIDPIDGRIVHLEDD